MKRPIESDYTSFVAYARALEQYCDEAEKQEPVGWMDSKINPIKREWVKLTDEEIQHLVDNPEPYYDRMFWFARTIERKLKEKNT